ncbi:YxeA family protein [Enterococcus sp. AZ126]|uniref:YxeA family protein n=1 Tax=Enterococcus sp. AZ126 TaxID=2774635 RepID=UPI003F24EDE1
MKKILGLIGIVVLCVAGYFGFNYYNQTYKTTTAYAQVPNEIPTKAETLDLDGKKVSGSYSYKYKVIFVKENGDKKQMDFELSGENPKPFDPGAFIKAEISTDRVNNPTQVPDSDVPNKVKAELGK